MLPQDVHAIASCSSLSVLHLSNLIDALPAFAASWPAAGGPRLAELYVRNCHDREGRGYGNFKAAFAHVKRLTIDRCIGLTTRHLAEALVAAGKLESLALLELTDIVDDSVLASICTDCLSVVCLHKSGGWTVAGLDRFQRASAMSVQLKMSL